MAGIVLPGKPYPLGATWDGTGTNFALFSEHATKVELCLFDCLSRKETGRIELRETTAFVHHGYVQGIQPGQLYGYRVYGPWDPMKGFRFNPAKLLIDPQAQAVCGAIDWADPLYPYQFGGADPDLLRDDRDDSDGMAKSVVVNPYFDWEQDRAPNTALSDSVIYELHVRGFSKQNPEVPEELRGTYAGLASPPSIQYLKRLGVTAVELLPVHQFIDDKRLVDLKLRNYWGYNTVAYFSPEARYSSSGDSGGQVAEFKAMVKALHRENIEVILDVVYNHTGEGNHLGPMLNFRGIDNTGYYRLVEEMPRYYMDYTGTGNTLNVRQPQVLKLIMDSLRYWVTEMHVDGFRFDLAAALARELHDVDRLSSFFDIIHQDPIISRLKLIAEPWDVGEGGYQVGNFPVLWAEWNGKYRDTVRRYWKGDEGQLSDLAYRLTGSSDLYKNDGRKPSASINFITAHDGFTLHDLVSYNDKHNIANGEDNRDGASDNNSWNMGAEGETGDPEILRARQVQMRNFLATLLLSQGVPMICGGDEISRTQLGNNNAYCQDNELSWCDWKRARDQGGLLDFVSRLIELRKTHPNLRRRNFYQDRSIRNSIVKDIAWFGADGHEMNEEEWNAGWIRSIAVLFNGETLDSVDEMGRPLVDDTFLILLNSFHDAVSYKLPPTPHDRGWRKVLDTSDLEHPFSDGPVEPAPAIAGRSLRLLRESREGE
jgi:glycogen operon protein